MSGAASSALTFTGGAGGAGGNGSAGGGGGGGGYGATVAAGTGVSTIGADFFGGVGGSGGNGGSGGGGGAGLALSASGSADVTFASTASATGGVGGAGQGNYSRGGTGGIGLLFANQSAGPATLTVAGSVTAGVGGASNGSPAQGGEGGVGLYVLTSQGTGLATVNVNTAIAGGAGGGAQAGATVNAGDGGVGIFVGNGIDPYSAGIAVLNVNANVTGGAGGVSSNGNAGAAGAGGYGIFAFNSKITVADGVTVSGGVGGAVASPLVNGLGGAGIAAANSWIVLVGDSTVQGGLGGDGTTRASALFLGGVDTTLELQANASGNLPTLIGGVSLTGTGIDTLVLGGTNDARIDATKLAGYATGFDVLGKGGTSTWTLTGDFSSSTLPWTIKAGTLSISADNNLGNVTAGVTLDGGTLLTTETITTARGFTLGAGGGTLSVADGKTLTLSTGLTGASALTKSGAGTLTLTADNTAYTGGVTINEGKLALSGQGSLAAASSVTVGKAVLDFSDASSATLKSLISSSAESRVILGSQTLTTQVRDAADFGGVISGSGGVNIAGTNGLFVLSGDNTYTGTTTITSNAAIGAGGNTGSVAGAIALSGVGTLTFNRSDTYTIANSITGAAGTALGFMGGGTFTYAGAGHFAGLVSVAGATLHLTGAEFADASSVEVYDKGVLSGNGTVSTLIIHDGGKVAPGNSPGTLAASTVTFEAGSAYRVDVTPTGEHDLISATGAVTIDKGAAVQVVAVPGRYKVDTSYAILTTAGTVTGEFGSVTTDYAFLQAALSYDAENVFLALHYTGANFADYARTPNQFTTATAAQALGSGNAVYDALVQQTAASAPYAYDALSGEAYASVGSVIQQQSIYLRDAVGGRLRQSLTAPGVSPLAYGAGPQTAALGAGLTPTLWVEGYGGWGDTYSNGNAATISNSIGGFLMGADVAVAETARAGLFAGYSQSQFDVTGRSSSGSMNNYDIGLYAGAQFGAFALRGGAAYSWHDVSMSRSIVFPGFFGATEGNFTTGTTQVFGEIGYDVEVGAYAFEPFAGLAYVNLSGTSFTESGGAAALSVSTGGMDTVYSTLGLRAATTLQLGGRTLTPHATVGWQHAFGDTTQVSTMQFFGGPTPFSVSGAPIAEDAVLLGAGLTYALSDKAQLGASYSGQLSGAASQNAFTVQFGLKF